MIKSEKGSVTIEVTSKELEIFNDARINFAIGLAELVNSMAEDEDEKLDIEHSKEKAVIAGNLSSILLAITRKYGEEGLQIISHAIDGYADIIDLKEKEKK